MPGDDPSFGSNGLFKLNTFYYLGPFFKNLSLFKQNKIAEDPATRLLVQKWTQTMRLL